MEVTETADNQNSNQDGSVIDFVLGNQDTVTTNQNGQDNHAPEPDLTGQNNQQDSQPDKQEGTTTNWIEEVAKISNNEINSVEVFNSFIEKYRKYDGLESDLERLKQENESLKNQNPFASEYHKKLNEIAKTGDMSKVKLFEKFNSVGDTNELDNYQAIKLQLQWKHNLTDDQAEAYLKENYKIDETLHSEDVVNAAKVKMQIDATSAKEFIAQQQASLDLSTNEQQNQQPTEEELQKKYQEKVEVLKPAVDSISNKLKDLFSQVNINGLKDDKANKVELPISQEVQNKVSESLLHWAATYGLDPIKDSSKLEKFAQDTAKIFLYDEHIIAASNLREKQLRAEFENPSSINRGINNPSGGTGNELASAASMVASGNF